MLLMKKNPFYTAPEAEFLVVRFEENFVNTGGNSSDNGYDDEYDLGEI